MGQAAQHAGKVNELLLNTQVGQLVLPDLIWPDRDEGAQQVWKALLVVIGTGRCLVRAFGSAEQAAFPLDPQHLCVNRREAWPGQFSGTRR